MTDHTLNLTGVKSVHQFNGGSGYKCAEAAEVDIVQLVFREKASALTFPRPYRSPEQLMVDLYEHYVGPDVPSNTNGTTKEQVIDFFNHVGIKFIDMQHLLEGDYEELRREITAQNLQGVAQFLTVSDESFLKYAKNGQSLHNWADALNHGHHCIVRVGFSDDAGYGEYLEPAAGLAFPQPVPILWSDIRAAGIMTCLAILPYGVEVPPAGFSFQSGAWPVPPKPAPVLDTTRMKSTLAGMIQAQDAIKAAMVNLANDIAQFEQEV